ncbi:MAG: hypothetical protein V4622_10560 [Bacteroidota bacterium]
MKKIFVLFAFFTALNFSSNAVKAQNFPSDREKFIKQFEKVLSGFIVKEQKDFIKDEFEPMLIETKDFSDSYFKKMVETCNLMETKKLKYYPAIYNYVFSVYSFVKNKQPNASFNAWHSSVDKLLDARNVNKFEDFIELSATFFSKNILSTNASCTWLFRGGSYSFEFTDKPFIQLEGGKLVCLIENSDKKEKKIPFVDSIVVYDAIGTYDPILKKWQGRGGVVSWEKVGLPKGETSAELMSYDLSLKSSNLGCDTVILTTPFFDKPIKGKLTDRAFRINREEDKIYPQFLSFEKRLKIDQIKPNVDYEGGFSLQGKDFVGIGNAQVPALLKISRNDKLFTRIQAQLVIVNAKRISCPLSKVSMYIGLKDSIFHPGLDFSYDLEKSLVELVRGTSGISQSPFSNSLHQLDMYVSRLAWTYDAPEIFLSYNFGSSQDQRFAKLESKNYFDSRLYDQLQGLESVNPLILIGNYCFKYDEYVVNEGKIATALGKTVEQSKSLMLDLAALGFLNYDTESKMVTVTQKLINFVKSKAGKMDYDNLLFMSDMRPKKLTGYSDEQIQKEEYLQEVSKKYEKVNKERNALKNFGSLNLGTLEINLDAVDNITISETQNTAVFPDDYKVTIKENRDFNFSGWIVAGKMELNSIEANYVYNSNKINLFKTDKSLFRVKPMSEQDGKQMITMVNEIQSITGELFVDAPNNRSGNNKKVTDFPKITVSKPTQVYYNHKSIFKGAYDSTRFYFTMDPFEMDSLDNFKESFQRFKGELTSAGIFPKMREDLKIMPDYSFGFSTKAATGGYDFYNTKAKYDNKIILSGKGLQGAGTINFIQSTTVSKAYTFLPDSTIGYGTFENKPVEEGVQYPDIISPDAFVTFIPKGNMLKAASTPSQELNMYNKEARLKGTAIITPQGCTGFGVVTFPDANLGAKLLKFTRWDIDSDTANFNLKNKYLEPGDDPLTLKTENLNAHVSFKTRKGQFRSNSGQSRVEFPNNQYMCKMDFFTWLMDDEAIELSTSADKDLNLKTDLDLVGANFFSLHPEQDSLRFRSREAKYSQKEKTIYCKKVEYMEIADARIYPDSGLVTIRKKARMDPLENTVLIANSITKYHKFVNCKVEVKARRVFEAEGDYPYYDADSTRSIIKMKSIKVDSSFQTVALGKIGPKDNFQLSKQFEYYGDVKINSTIPLISFSGATRIIHTCDKFTRSWMAFTSAIDPKNIQIPVSSEMKSLDSLSLTAGIVWRDSKKTDEITLYPTFLSEIREKGDQVVFTSNGFLQYSAFTNEFQIASKEKLINRGEKGNYLALQAGNCSLNGDGVIKLGMDYGPTSVDAVGTVNYYQESGQTNMNLTVKYNLPLEEKSFEKIAEKLNSNVDSKPMDFGSTTFEKALVEWTDRKTADKVKSDYTVDGVYRKIPDQMKASVVITGLKVSSFSNPKMEERGLYTDVESAVVVSVFDKAVMKYFPVKAFFQQIYSGAGGDKYGLLITNPAGSEYFLNYSMGKKDGELFIYSGDVELETAVNELKPDKRKAKDFSYEMTTNRIYLSKFLKLFSTPE